jgi:hypothetical protein
VLKVSEHRSVSFSLVASASSHSIAAIFSTKASDQIHS